MSHAHEPARTGLAPIGDELRGRVARGEVAGALAPVAWPGGVHVDMAGMQDVAAGTPMLTFRLGLGAVMAPSRRRMIILPSRACCSDRDATKAAGSSPPAASGA